MGGNRYEMNLWANKLLEIVPESYNKANHVTYTGSWVSHAQLRGFWCIAETV